MDRRRFIVLAGALTAHCTTHNFAVAQGTKLPRIALIDKGDVTTNMVEGGHPYWSALLGQLRELGWVEGETIGIERWSGRELPENGFAELLQRLADSRPDLIVARGRTAIIYARAATEKIPIVGLGTFPQDLQAKLGRPGGNLTGMSSALGGAIFGKKVQILKEIVPSASRFGMLTSRQFWSGPNGAKARNAATELGIKMVPFIVDEPITESTIRVAIKSLQDQNLDAVYVSGSQRLYAHRNFLAQEIAKTRLPSIALQLEHARAGQLMSYAPDFADSYRRLATYVDRILRGADPGELPIEQPTEVKLVINLKTARTLGITVPPKLMLQAAELIE